MKQKYLLSMLLGGALLTACSVDDDLNLANVAQEANPSAPVFNLSFEDDALTRADYVNHKVVFSVADGDLLSLYNGIDKDKMTTGGITDFGTYQNAVYEASGSDNDFKLTTRAMVGAGKAIMVYPVDTVNINPSDAPKISIKTTQNDETLKLTPYMSSVLKIEERSEGGNVGNHEAGYGRTYDVKMKRAASLFALTINLKETQEIKDAVNSGDLGDPEILSVELTTKTETDKIYTESIAITTADKDKNGFDEEDNKKPHPYWIGSTSLDDTNVDQTESITTSAMDGNTVFFTLLPFEQSVDYSKAKLIVHTTYGDVAVSGDTALFSNPYKGSSKEAASDIKDKEKLTVAQFLQYLVAPNVGTENTSSSADFDGEYVGKATQGVSVEIDLADVDMSNMHIKTGAALKDAITLFSVIKAGKTDETATFHLLGASEDDKTFEMNKTQWTVLENQLEKEKNPITIALCPATEQGKNYTKCEAIKLTADGTTEIPDLAFETAVDVQLNGKTWTYPSNPEFAGTKSLTLLKDAVMELTGAVKVKDASKAKLEEITINKDATVNVTGSNVTLEIKSVINKGTINIGGGDNTNANLYVQGANVILTNEAATENPADENGKKDNYDSYCWNECGKINNYGGLAVANTGKIYNYGLIESKNAGAKTLITQNAMSTETNGVSTKNIDHSKTKIGSIVMLVNNQTVAVDGEKGFIKYTLPDGAGFDKNGCGTLANYIIVDENSSVSELKDNVTTVNNAPLATIKYLDINKQDFKFNAYNKFNAVIVRSTGVSVGSGVSVDASEAIYLTGTIFHAGVESTGTYVTWESAGQGTENFFGKSTGKLLFTGKKAE